MLPSLLYDTEICRDEFLKNRPFRNIGDLLVSSCPSVMNILRLCGAEERVFNNCSDYERFTALCYSMPYIHNHPVKNGINTILQHIFSFYDELSPYNIDEAWQTLNEIIENECITPSTLLSSLNVESVCLRVGPFDDPICSLPDIDIYSVLDLNNITEIISSEKNNCISFADFIKKITDFNSYSSIGITFNSSYSFVRNSKKLELEGIYLALKEKKDVSDSDINAIITSVVIELARCLSNNNKPFIIRSYGCINGLEKLFDYLSLNKILPDDALVAFKSLDNIENFLIKHTKRNLFGLPSIVPIHHDLQSLSKIYPIGFAIQICDNITDIVKAASFISESVEIEERFGEEMGENISCINIKNRFHI